MPFRVTVIVDDMPLLLFSPAIDCDCVDAKPRSRPPPFNREDDRDNGERVGVSTKKLDIFFGGGSVDGAWFPLWRRLKIGRFVCTGSATEAVKVPVPCAPPVDWPSPPPSWLVPKSVEPAPVAGWVVGCPKGFAGLLPKSVEPKPVVPVAG